MGERLKEIFLQRGHTDDQDAHEKMLNITNYQKNANQNSNKVSQHANQNDHNKKNLQTVNAGEGVENRGLLNCWWECKLIQSLWITVWKFLKKLRIELQYNLAILFLDRYSEKTIIYAFILKLPFLMYFQGYQGSPRTLLKSERKRETV